MDFDGPGTSGKSSSQAGVVGFGAGMSSAATAASAGQVMEKRKRGRPPRGADQAPKPKRTEKEEEDVCFICFDGGHLVLCDRKGCPKAYHPACIKRDESFFGSKSKWNCGWHICSVCLKAAHHMCYTCTYSLCKKCIKDAEYVCIRGNSGFCATCMKTIMLIENEGTGSKEKIQVDFDDQSSWEYLFKVYWILLKDKLSLTLSELKHARNLWRGVFGADFKPLPPENSAENGAMPNVVKLCEHSELRTTKEELQLPVQNSLGTENLSHDKSTIVDGCGDWASKELLEFVAHMKNGDATVLSHLDVQALLLEYVKKNNLQDPHRKSQIICDARLKNLFQKLRVSHIEMLKLLDYHLLKKDDNQKKDFIPARIVGSLQNYAGSGQHQSPVLYHNKRRKTTRKVEDKTHRNNLDDYAAIDVHNINLIFLRRSMLENLLGEVERFHDKVVGSIVRIRMSTDDQKPDMYRLVQVVGISKGAEPYKLGDKTADIMLEVLNLNKKETMSIDTICDQDFSEDECRRLRQSMKFGLVRRFSVGEIQTKAIALQDVKLDDCLAAKILQLNHLQDRAREKGHKKEHRECIKKLQILNSPEERQRRLSKIPEVHADPKMNPNYESEDDASSKDQVSRLRYFKLDPNANSSVHPQSGAKEDDPVTAQRLQENRDEDCSDNAKQENHVTAGASFNVWGNQAMVRSDIETATPSSLTRDSPSVNSFEMEKIWHYRDPNGKIQGPFSILQLQMWSTTGYFPADMKIWNNSDETLSVALDDAVNGKLCKVSQLFHSMSMQSREVGNAVDNRANVVCSGASSDRQEGVLQCTDSTVQLNGSDVFDRVETRSRNYICESSQQNRQLVPLNVDLNDKDNNTDSVANPCKSSEQKGDSNHLELPSPNTKTSTRNLKGRSSEHQESAFLEIRAADMQRSMSIDAHIKDIGISDLPSHTPNSVDEDQRSRTSNPSAKGDLASPLCKPSDEGHGGQNAASEHVSSKIPIKDSGWSNVSGLVVGDGQMQGQWEPGKDFLAPNVPGWHAINEPIEFSTLAESSVSDLLAEVDAMVSQNGFVSPTSAARCVDDMMDRNDCFSSIEDLSPTPDTGKSDALSSTADIPFPSLEAVMDDLFGTPDADVFDPLIRSGGHSTTGNKGETKSTDATVRPWEFASDMHPPTSCTMNQVMVSENMARGRGLDTVDAGWATTQGNMNLGWAGPPQGFGHTGWGPSLGTSWVNPNFNLGAYNETVGWGSPCRYGGERFAGSRDWPFRGGGLGYGKARSVWNRQSQGGGGEYPRPPSKGQRVCKYYESGHCKKGALCDYLHP